MEKVLEVGEGKAEDVGEAAASCAECPMAAETEEERELILGVPGESCSVVTSSKAESV